MSGSISLPYYSLSNRTFGVFADIDGSKANTSLFQQRSIVIGQMLPPGPAMAGVPVLITSLVQAAGLFGLASMLYAMVKQAKGQDPFGELWALPLADPAGTAASGTTTLAGTATASGTLALYYGGWLVPVPVNVGDTAAVLAARWLAIAATMPELPVTSTAAGAVITHTARHVGVLGNDLDLRQNYLGAPGGEYAVAGITVAFTPMAGGSGVPSGLAAALAALNEKTFDFFGLPYTDTASLNAMDAFLSEVSGRWCWQQMLFGAYFTAARGTPGVLQPFGTARNGKFGTCLGVFDTPDPIWLVAADYMANCAVSLRADPNQPLQNIALGFKPPPFASRFNRSIRNTMLYSGISTFTVVSGVVILERACTFYQVNNAGAPDNSFLDVETIYGLAYLLRRWQNRMITLFPRKKLVQDGTTIPPGSNLVSPSTIKFATISWYREECDAGNAQDPDGFARTVISQNAGNGLDKELLPFVLVNQLREIAALAQFSKP